MSPRDALRDALQDRLGLRFADPDLLERALTHASVGDGARLARRHADNERLEFLGDRVVGLLTAEALLAEDPDAREGDLALRLNSLVNRDALAAAARRMALGDALRLSAAETRTGGREKASILADACEAVMGAVYLDAGLEAARRVFDRFWRDALRELGALGGKDPKTDLQERAQRQGRPAPVYRVVAREGPDHAPLFTVEAEVVGAPPAQGSGASRQAAEKAAARALLAQAFASS
jgi:ribonuclease-3